MNYTENIELTDFEKSKRRHQKIALTTGLVGIGSALSAVIFAFIPCFVFFSVVFGAVSLIASVTSIVFTVKGKRYYAVSITSSILSLLLFVLVFYMVYYVYQATEQFREIMKTNKELFDPFNDIDSTIYEEDYQIIQTE